jgi:hypothetical protein
VNYGNDNRTTDRHRSCIADDIMMHIESAVEGPSELFPKPPHFHHDTPEEKYGNESVTAPVDPRYLLSVSPFLHFSEVPSACSGPTPAVNACSNLFAVELNRMSFAERSGAGTVTPLTLMVSDWFAPG